LCRDENEAWFPPHISPQVARNISAMNNLLFVVGHVAIDRRTGHFCGPESPENGPVKPLPKHLFACKRRAVKGVRGQAARYMSKAQRTSSSVSFRLTVR